MRLLNILLQLKNKLFLVVLAILIGVFTISPVIRGGLDGVFYSIDPEVVYTSNAMLFIKSGNVAYVDHPGTPAVVAISFLLAPLRVYAKVIDNIPFADWAFNNFSELFLYLRISMAILLASSLIILFTILGLMTKKTSPTILFVLALLSFSPFYTLGSIISADVFAFFIASIWLLGLTYYLSSHNQKTLVVLCLIAGLAFADRATTFFIIPASLALLLFEKDTFLKRADLFVSSILALIVGFVGGIAPSGKSPLYILNMLFSFADSTGIHTSGQHVLFSLSPYIDSVYKIIQTDLLSAAILMSFSILGVFALTQKDSVYKKLGLIMLIFSFGGLIFAKFPVLRYEITNYTIIAFVGAFLYSKILKNIYLPIFILLVLSIPIAMSYLNVTTGEIYRTKKIEAFVNKNPSKYAVAWEYATTKEFAYLWSKDYTKGLIFQDQTLASLVKIYEFRREIMKIEISKYQDKDISDICWDQMYVQNESLDKVLTSYKYDRAIQEISGTGMFLIQSNHCADLKK